MTVEADFSDIGRLQTMLGGASNKVTSKMPAVLDEVTAAVVADAQRRAPVESGDLQNDIGVKRRAGTAVNRTRWIGSDLRQGFFQEFGTSAHPPQPWLNPAADAGVSHLVDKLGELGEPF